ncbi:hypothetical protein PV04_04891 [Phialophora macrospora]|uniref:Uncharacterized protein n=1 Tax=Phialophora macrospora TaxID=1851006 RepID=A0A0D2GAI9_9EURO|nr:hypothetical protein PV04_04891 [Phialophora macrospora]
MNPPSGPPPPPPDDPREAFLHKFKGEIIALMLHYKAGMFRGKINWSAKLVDFFDVLLQSPALDKNERILFARLAYQIGTLKSIADSDNNWMSQTTRQEHHHTMQTLRALVDVEKAARGRHSLTQSLRNAGFNNLSFEAAINGVNQVGPARREEYPAASNYQQMDTILPSGNQSTYTALLGGMQSAAPGSFQLPTFDNQNPPLSGHPHPHFQADSVDFHFEGLGNVQDPVSSANDADSLSASNTDNQWLDQQSNAEDWVARAWQMMEK